METKFNTDIRTFLQAEGEVSNNNICYSTMEPVCCNLLVSLSKSRLLLAV
jgi:hypothetical protein